LNSKQKIRCYDVFGQATDVAADQIEFATAVYGILITNDNILLIQQPKTRLWHPPGDHLQRGETPEQLLRDTFRQITRADLTAKTLLHVEDQYRIDRRGKAWHIAALYYAVQRPSTGILAPIPGGQATLSWQPLATLTRKQMQFGYTAVQAGRRWLQK
jgi:ADP-ribose pyrophosphatase YjhB (NUDIX family)